MADRVFNVLFLCTGNTARSILAESILRKDGAGRFRAFSAGSHPKRRVNPFALKVLESLDYPTEGLRSKGWEEFAAPGAPEMDFVFTVCDNAAGEACPVWPGQPMTAHWGIEDPAAVEGRNVFMHNACISCHTIRGTVATGRFGPDLTHVGSRETIASASVPNTPANLREFIDNPANLKPGALMPPMHLDPHDLDAVTAYLTTLK